MKKIIVFLMAFLPFFAEAQSLIFSNSSVSAARTKLKNNSTQYTMTMYGGEFYIVGKDTSYQMFKAGGTNSFSGNIILPATTTIGNVSPAQISYLDSLSSPIQISFLNVAEMRTKMGKYNQKANLIGYYTKGDGGGGELYWDSNSTATDNGGTVFQVSGITVGRWIRILSNTINPKWFGAKLDGTTDDTTPIQNSLDLSSEKTLVLSGNAKITNTLTFTGSNLTIEGNGHTISHITNQSTTLDIHGSTNTYVTNAEITSNSTTIPLGSTSGLAKGDVLYIVAHASDSLWSKERSYYVKGEFVEIDSVVTGVSIITTSPVVDSYISGATATRINNRGIKIKNLNFVRANNLACLTLYNIADVDIDNCNISGANERGMYIYNAYNVQIKNSNIKGKYYTGSGTSYGLVIASCQNVNIIGGSYFAGRHGITLGGTFPVRYINISNVIVDNSVQSSSNAAALDFHSNVQYATVSNLLSKNGITLSGIDITVTNCITTGRSYYPFLFLAIRNAENTLNVNGLTITNNSIYSSFGFSSAGNGSTYRVSAGNVTVNNVTANSLVSMSGSTAAFMFAGSLLNNISYKTINVSNVSISSTIEQPSSTYAVGFATNSSTINEDAVINISNLFTNFRARCFLMGSGNIGAVVNIENSYMKSYFSGSTNYNSRFGIATYKISNTVFDGLNNSFVEGTGGSMSFTGCNFMNMTTNCFYGTNLTYIGMNNCTKNNSANMFYQGGTSPQLIDATTSSNNVRNITKSAAPTAGTWAVGDITYNTSPAVGSNVGWICTTAGTPGTWTQFGIIYNSLEASVTYNPPSLATLTQATNPMTVTNAVVGDYVTCSFSNSLGGVTLTGYVSSSGTVTPVFFNGTSGTVDLASGTLKCKIIK